MKDKKILKWIIVIGVIALLGFLVFRLTSTDDLKGEEIKVVEGDIATYYNFTGSIEAKNRSKVFSETPIQISEF